MILGVNPGSAASHQRFASQLKLNFPLLVDAERKVAEAYQALKENGTSIERTVVIIDKEGQVGYAKQGMPPDSELLEAIKAF